MTGLATSALRLRDDAVVSLFGFASIFSGFNAVLLLVVRRSFDLPPSFALLITAQAALVVSFLFAMARYRILRGRPAVSILGVAAIVHALFGAFCLRAGIHAEGTTAVVFGAVGGYALTMAILLAWCVRVPIRLGRGEGDAGRPAGRTGG